MKNLFYFIVICIGAYWLYNRCSDDDGADKGNYLKQVSVVVETANLRVGPGTAYDYATRKADGSGGQWQVKRGTVLNVKSVKQGWYEVNVGKDERSVYIKQSLCSDVKGKGKAKRTSSPGSSSKPSNNKAAGTATQKASTTEKQETESQAATNPDEVKEVVGQTDDEVIF